MEKKKKLKTTTDTGRFFCCTRVRYKYKLIDRREISQNYLPEDF